MVMGMGLRSSTTNENFNRILGGLRNFIKDEVRAAVREEIEKAKREAAARRAQASQCNPQPTAQGLISVTEVGTIWKSRDKRRRDTVTVVTSDLATDRVIVRTASGRLAQSSLQKFIKRHTKVR